MENLTNENESHKNTETELQENKKLNNQTNREKEPSKKMALWAIIISLLGIFIFSNGVINAILVLIALFLNITAWIAYVPYSHTLYNIVALILVIIAFW